MAYDDGYYYGQCKIVCEAETIADNGKTVTISNGSRSWSGVITNKIYEALVPGRGQYTITLLDEDDETEWTGTVEAGYGECIHQMLADGYEAVMEKSKLTLQEIMAAPGSVADYVPDADAVKAINTNLVANSTPFVFDYQNGKYGYNTDTNRGADTFFPFKASPETMTSVYDSGYTRSAGSYIVSEDGAYIVNINTRNNRVGISLNNVAQTYILSARGYATGSAQTYANTYFLLCSVGDVISHGGDGEYNFQVCIGKLG